MIGRSVSSAILYVHLAVVFILLSLARALQFIIYTFYWLFPFKGLLDALYNHSRALRNLFSFRLRTSRTLARDTVGICNAAGVHAEVHQCTTSDGFVLCLHRVVNAPPHRRPSAAGSDSVFVAPAGAGSPMRVSADPGPPGSATGAGASASASASAGTVCRGGDQCSGDGPLSNQKPVVLLMHGLMQSSEFFVVGGRTHTLAFALLDAGFDVWLGNNRGNKYSGKHLTLTPNDEAYWNFSLDDLARYDVPAMVDYVLTYTRSSKLAYVGFSQGTAQCFASLASQPRVASRISAFVALSPAVTVRGLSRSFMTSLVEANDDFLFALFGRKAMLPSAHWWAQTLSPTTFAQVIDRCVLFLFGWSMRQISDSRKAEVYATLYSTSSTKSVRHWFQLMRTGRFEMFRDGRASPHSVPPLYDVTTIRTPLAVFVGGKDGVIDPDRLMKLLPANVAAHVEADYEHLDFCWSDTAPQRVFPRVIDFLETHVQR